MTKILKIIYLLIIFDVFILGLGFNVVSHVVRALTAILLVVSIFILKDQELRKRGIFAVSIFLLISILTISGDNLLLETSSFFLIIGFVLLSIVISRQKIKLHVGSKELFILLSAVYFQVLYMYFSEGVITLLRGDRNHSGIILIFLTYWLAKNKPKMVKYLVPLFVLLLSRNPVFSLILGLMIFKLNIIRFRRVSFIFSLFLFVSLPLITNHLFEQQFGHVEVSGTNGIERFTQIKDGSNVLRFKVAGEQLLYIGDHLKDFIFSSNSINNLTRNIRKSEMPHNSFVELVYRFGLLRLVIILFIISTFRHNKISHALWISLIFSGSIIHNVFVTNLILLVPYFNIPYERR